jgi:hypothetical protein
MNRAALLRLWSMDEIPACDKGMELAQAFLVCAGEGVDRLGVEEPGDRLAELRLREHLVLATCSFPHRFRLLFVYGRGASINNPDARVGTHMLLL